MPSCEKKTCVQHVFCTCGIEACHAGCGSTCCLACNQLATRQVPLAIQLVRGGPGLRRVMALLELLKVFSTDLVLGVLPS